MGTAVVKARKVEIAETAKLSAGLAQIFQHDPMVVHLLPDQASREVRMERVFRLFLQRIYLPHQECSTLGAFLGGAIWLPPGKHKGTASLGYVASAAGIVAVATTRDLRWKRGYQCVRRRRLGRCCRLSCS